MIRHVNTGAQFTYRRLGSALAISTTFNPVTAGISAGVGLATAGIQAWMSAIQTANMGKAGSTAVANALAQQLDNLKAAYFAEPNPTCADQRAALDAFDAAMIWFESPQGCGNPAFGAAGERCIQERAYPGAIYSYVDATRTPIANDPRLASAGCNTANAVILPSLQTGGFANTGIGSSATPAGVAADAVAASQGAAATTASPNLLLIAAAAIGAVLIAKAS